MVRIAVIDIASCANLASSHVPVIACGFEDLQKRVEAQTQQANDQQQKIKVRPS